MSTNAVKDDERVVCTAVVGQLDTYLLSHPTKYWCNCVRVFRVDSFSHILPNPVETSKFIKILRLSLLNTNRIQNLPHTCLIYCLVFRYSRNDSQVTVDINQAT